MPESSLDIYGPRQEEGPLGEVFSSLMCPPYFPITPEQLGATVKFHDTGDDDFPVGHAEDPFALGAPRRPHARVPR